MHLCWRSRFVGLLAAAGGAGCRSGCRAGWAGRPSRSGSASTAWAGRGCRTPAAAGAGAAAAETRTARGGVRTGASSSALCLRRSVGMTTDSGSPHPPSLYALPRFHDSQGTRGRGQSWRAPLPFAVVCFPTRIHPNAHCSRIVGVRERVVTCGLSLPLRHNCDRHRLPWPFRLPLWPIWASKPRWSAKGSHCQYTMSSAWAIRQLAG